MGIPVDVLDDLLDILEERRDLLQLARVIIKLPCWEKRSITLFYCREYLEYISDN